MALAEVAQHAVARLETRRGDRRLLDAAVRRGERFGHVTEVALGVGERRECRHEARVETDGGLVRGLRGVIGALPLACAAEEEL